MRRYSRTGVCIFLAVLAAGTLSGCKEIKKEIVITDISHSTEDDEPNDNMPTQLPGEDIPDYEVALSDEPGDFELAIWGETLTLPLSYEAFVESGWRYEGDEEAMIGSRTYLEGEIFTAEESEEHEKARVRVDLMNPTAAELPAKECYVAGILVDAGIEEESAVYINLPDKILFQKATEDEVLSSYGKPKDRYEQENVLFLMYEFGMNQMIRMGFSQETGVMTTLMMRNLLTPEDEKELANAFSKKTERVEAYEPPKEEGTQLSDCILSYDGVLYQLPVPVSVMLENGWKVNRDESDSAVRALDYGYATLEKNGRKLFGTVQNPEEMAVTIENCFVTSLYGDLDTTKIPITAAGGITLGMSEEAFLKAVTEPYRKEAVLADGLIVYRFSTGEEQTAFTEITVDAALRLIRGIKVTREVEESDVSAEGAEPADFQEER